MRRPESLPRVVVDKIYRLNAQAMFIAAWSTPPE
jgi:hypothetical protein